MTLAVQVAALQVAATQAAMATVLLETHSQLSAVCLCFCPQTSPSSPAILFLLWAELFPPNSQVEVLTPCTSVWSWGPFSGDQGKGGHGGGLHSNVTAVRHRRGR